MTSEELAAGKLVARGAGRRWGPYLRTGNLPALLYLISLAIATAYLLLFVAQLPHNLRALGWVSDYASGFTVPETLVQTGTGGHTLLGSTGAWVPLWFGLLTATLPLHRELWEIAPTLLLFFTALTIGWSVAQIANRRAAILAALIVFVASPVALDVFMAAVAHNMVYPCTALLGAYLIWLAQDGRRRPAVFAVPPLAGVALGVCLASDVLLAVTGVLPFAVTAILAGLRRGRRSRLVALSALTTVVIAVPIAKLTSTIMGSLGYVTLPPSTEIAPLSTLSLHAELLLEGLKEIFNGNIGHIAPGTVGAELGLACEIVMAAALLTLLVVGVVRGAKFLWSGLHERDSTTSVQLATALHVIYWVASAVAVSVAFSFNVRVESTHLSYYATILFSVAAVVPLLMSGRSPARWLVPVGASIFFAASLLGLTRHLFDGAIPAIARYESNIVKFAKANHVTTGFAGYWEASSLTWSSHDRVLARPVGGCANPEGAGICPFPLERVPSWYVPKQPRTFLLVDPHEIYLPSLPNGLGRPLAVGAFGAARMYVYPYDIASRIASPSD